MSMALEADGAGPLSGMPGIKSQIFSLLLLRIEPCHPPRVTSHHTEAKALVTSPNLQQLQRSACLCVSMYACVCTCVPVEAEADAGVFVGFSLPSHVFNF